ncbi:MAG: tetratricopeptide repeat protein [Pseudonocardiaceae bacterium]
MAVPSPGREAVDAAAAEAALCALLKQLKDVYGGSYEELGAQAGMSHGAAGNYIRKRGHRRDTKSLKSLLTALGASEQDRDRALKLHQQTLLGGADPAEVGWETRARAVNCKVSAMAQFTATVARVHTAIGSRHSAHPHNPDQAADSVSPPYVPRAHDVALRRDIAAAAAGDLRALIVVRGTSSTGKTRSLFEAVHKLCPGWTVIRPRDADAVSRLPESGLFDRRCVVWLNELQGFLGPNGCGLSVDVLERLYAAATRPVVLVGTLWPDKLRAATDARDELTSDTRELLAERTSWVHWHEVPRTLTTDAERAAARNLAANDSRLARAVADPDRCGFAQTLAGAHELLEHYHNADPETDRLLLEAAADARRLGHSHALSGPLLRAVTLALWREDNGPTSPPTGWFDHALDYATTPLRADGGVRALIPLDDPNTPDDDSEPIGYDLADYLEENLTRARRAHPVQDQVWDALRRHTDRTADLKAMAQAASHRLRHGHVESLYRRMAAFGDPHVIRELAWWLRDCGRDTEAEETYREAAAAGEPEALHELARWLRERGQDTEAEETYREAAAAGDQTALNSLAWWLKSRPGREADVDATYRQASAAGDQTALNSLAQWLSNRPGQQDKAMAVWREAIEAGHPGVVGALVRWLSRQPGQEDKVEEMLRDAVTAGHPDAQLELARWLSRQPGKETEAERLWRQAAALGDSVAMHQLAWWLTDQPGREADTEVALRQAAAHHADGLSELADWLHQHGRTAEAVAAWREVSAGYPGALLELGEWLWRRGQPIEAEKAYRDAAAAGEPEALRELAWWFHVHDRPAEAEKTFQEAAKAGDSVAIGELALWLRDQGRQTDAEAALRQAAAAGEGWTALGLLATWLRERGKHAEAEALCRDAAAAGERDAQCELALLLRERGQETAAEQTYREAAAAGLTQALRELSDWLCEQGRETDAEALWRDAIVAGNRQASDGLLRLLMERSGRTAEADRIRRFGLDARGRTAQPAPI